MNVAPSPVTSYTDEEIAEVRRGDDLSQSVPLKGIKNRSVPDSDKVECGRQHELRRGEAGIANHIRRAAI